MRDRLPQKPLTILSVAYPFAPVSPSTSGGAEQILSSLDRALLAHGHTSLVVACAGSEVRGTCFPHPLAPGEILTEEDRAASTANVQHSINEVLSTQPVDLVHLHGMDFHQYRLPPEIPVLVTLHMPITWYPAEAQARFQSDSGLHLCCVSHAQQRSGPPALKAATVIPNGVALEPWQPRPRERYAVMMGRICPEKNAADGLAAGTLAQMPVRIAGQVFPYREHRNYMDQQISPRLKDGHQFLGPLGPTERHDLLSRATCLLHPTLAPETSSLVAMEALAAGTPVIAYRSGALPEIVEDGVTGFLVDSVEEMAGAIARVDTLSHQACRHAAEQRFDEAVMAGQYLELYQALVRRLHA